MLNDIDTLAAPERWRVRIADRYCYFGGGSSTQAQQQQTSTNTVDPAEEALLQGNYATAQQNAAQIGQPYQGMLTAALNPTQVNSQGILSGVATDPQYAANNNTAISGVQGVLGTPVTAQPYTASQLSNTALSPYENPYTSDVINTTNAQIAQQRGQAQVGDNQAATAAGAFGGSRSGVANALTNQYYDQDTSATDAGLNQANYTQAQNAAQSDVAAQNAASQFNSSQNVNTQQQNIANQLNASSQLSTLNNSALQTAATQGGILAQVGDAQQAQSQTELTNAYQAWLTGASLTVQQQNLLNSALGLMPNQQTISTNGTSSSSTQSDPGLGSILGGLGSLGAGLGKSGLGLSLSDARAKSDVETIRFDGKGRRWVSFRYNWEPVGTRHEGVIAQEIANTDPTALHVGEDGLLRVDYFVLAEAA
jgi:hypothetical protein